MVKKKKNAYEDIRFWLKIEKERDHKEDLNLGGSIALKLILER
jgi:hypothetical protein